MPTFSKSSETALATCHPRLQQAARELIDTFDFAVLEGHRDQSAQDADFATGRSKLKWPNGKHNAMPSKAFDIGPYHPQFGVLIGTPEQLAHIASSWGISIKEAAALVREHYCFLAGQMLAVARSQLTTLRWGGDWNRNNSLFDNSFDDLGHFELET